MERPSLPSAEFAQAVAGLLRDFVAYLPNLAAAALLLLIGWFAARLLRALATRAARGIDRLLRGFDAPAGVDKPRLGEPTARLFGNVVFWIVALCFLAAVSQLLGLTVFTDWLSEVVRYLPTVVVGALIIAAGLLLSRLARDIVLAAAGTSPPRQRALIARVVQAVILATAILVGAEQIGIKITFLVILAVALAGAVAATVAVAASLGARVYVADLIGARRARGAFIVGQTVRLGALQGRILEITALSVVLEVPEGRAAVPARLFTEQAVIVLMGEDAHHVQG